ncbi:ABC-2 family transporter protein [Brevibacillus humidisoli]|uniref:ABC transporter permease n=1 Tax=Brevibacillus humidisoli TaxID=2895522 RepID=UPI001E2A3844|nr:ABC-2 family transporter protein [Brevibacillus humidisoli]UFJ42475.1 ABC-2 family transporter protein [Brevibacillus humidisoli]
MKYLLLSGKVMRSSTIYRFEILTRIVATLFSVFAIRWVWIALLQNTGYIERIGVTLDVMLTYATVSMILQALYGPTIVFEISQRIQNGMIAIDFQRPWEYQIAMLSRLLGMMGAGMVTVMLPVIAVTAILFPVNLPETWSVWVFFLTSVMLGIIVQFTMQFFIGLLAFPFVEVWSFEIMLSSAIAIFSGRVLPVWIFPDLLRDLIYILPFRCLYDIPIQIYTGTATPDQYLGLLSLQAGWAIALLLLTKGVSRYFENKLLISGG